VIFNSCGQGTVALPTKKESRRHTGQPASVPQISKGEKAWKIPGAPAFFNNRGDKLPSLEHAREILENFRTIRGTRWPLLLNFDNF